MKKFISLIMVACILMMCPVICSAASTLYEYSAVEVIDYPNEMTVEDVIRKVAEEAKKEAEANPDKEYYVVGVPTPSQVSAPVISIPKPVVTPAPVVNKGGNSSFFTFYRNNL